MPTEDDIFIALGRPEGIANGFQTRGANIMTGVYSDGVVCGVMGQSATPLISDGSLEFNRVGVVGRGDNLGVYGMTDNAGPNSGFNGRIKLAGVFGTSDSWSGVVGTSFEAHGVYGQAGDPGEPAGSAGVCGSSRQRIGVVGSSSENVAVFGQANKSIGVFGTSNESSGVIGQSSGPASMTFNLNAGVFGTSADAIGVAGTSANTVGVLGTSTSNFGMIAISGQAGPIFGVPFSSPAAVFGTSAKGTGVVGTSTATDGVFGFSSQSYGVYGLSSAQTAAGVNGESSAGGIGVLGVSASTKTSPGVGVKGVGDAKGIGVVGVNPAGFAGVFQGNLAVSGQIFAGVKDAIVPFPDGSKRLLHCMESPEHWFEDFGSARLRRGRATVKLDADFAKVVTPNSYRVFVTPEGNCCGLYVRRKRGASFEVRELQGGISNVAFSFRIVARRKDIKRHTRFAKIDMPIHAPVAKARAARKPLPSTTRALFTALEKGARKKGRA